MNYLAIALLFVVSASVYASDGIEFLSAPSALINGVPNKVVFQFKDPQQGLAYNPQDIKITIRQTEKSKPIDTKSGIMFGEKGEFEAHFRVKGSLKETSSYMVCVENKYQSKQLFKTSSAIGCSASIPVSDSPKSAPLFGARKPRYTNEERTMIEDQIGKVNWRD